MAMVETQVTSDAQRLAESLGELPEPQVKPTLIVISGLPGTGKTYLSKKLAERLQFAVLESDALRKSLFSPPAYSPAESSRLFQAIHLLIEKLLRKGIPIILDATNLSERYRERLYHIAERLDARLILVRVDAPPEVVRRRLEERAKDKEKKSDADWEVFQRMRPTVQKISRNYFSVDTSKDVTPALEKIVKEARR